MASKNILISVDEDKLRIIDECAKRTNRSRSNFLINAGLDKVKEEENN